METAIPFSQKLYFLAIHPEKGGINSWSFNAIDYVLIGSLFMELYLQKKLRFENKRIVVLDAKSDHPLYRYMLGKMSRSKSPRKISTWISRFHINMKFIRKEVEKDMIGKRLIRMEPKRFLFFKWTKPYVFNKKVINQLVREVQDQIMQGTSVEEELILLSFIEPGGLHYRLFPERQKRREARKRLKQMMVGNRVSAAVADAISAAQAVAASVAVTAAASSTATS